MKKVLVTIALLGFGFSAQADHMYEVQINGGFGGTTGGISINDLQDEAGNTLNDNTSWELGGEVYRSISESFQLGGILSLANNGSDGADTVMSIGVAGRYNFDADHRNSMFAGLGLAMTDIGDADWMTLGLNLGKRYALSNTITWTPNVELNLLVSGDVEGNSIVINLLSFSGFM